MTSKLFEIYRAGKYQVNISFFEQCSLHPTDKRAWLVKIHCANYHVELAVKEVTIDSKFKTVDNMYIIIFGLLKNSGKIKGIIQEICKSENVQHFPL